MSRRRSLLILSDALYILSILYLINAGVTIFSHGTRDMTILFLSVIILMPLFEAFSERMPKILWGYFISIFLISDLITLFLDFSVFIVMILQILSFILGIRYIIENIKERLYRFAYILYGLIMMFIASLLRYDPIEKIGNILVANISDDVKLSGIPIFFQNGIVIFSQRFFIFSISIQFTVIILLLGFLLLENSRKIIEIAGSNQSKGAEAFGLTSMSFSVLSCQCETTTSIIPAIGAEILGIISVPVIMESLILSLMTFILIHYLEKHGNNSFFEIIWKSNETNLREIVLSIIAILFIPIFVTLGSFYNLQSNLFFYFGTSIGVFVISTYIFFNVFKFLKIRIHVGVKIMSLLSFAILILMIIWYWPLILEDTIHNGVLFSLMGIISILNGFMFSIILSGLDKGRRIIASEYVAGMFPVLFVIALYYSIVTESVIWPIYSLATQEIFSLVLLGISLPFMWFATNYSIYSQYTRNYENVYNA
ncbi:hypothetical protein ACNF42_00265 [Cuniculiplasma sp. SKW3]|uniref:hypothetical protein n=1 Tax=Cuniculiplasma sp. SKW3 TaxID=3400170 RepID=UPI003FCFA320